MPTQHQDVVVPGTVYAGTSGFAYATWKPEFYPKDVPASRFLTYYASQFNIVESNFTFRKLPSAKTVEKWIQMTPEGFLFSAKAHMRITHILKLQGAREFVQTFLESLAPLRESQRLGPIVFQLPPTFRASPAILEGFLSELPAGYRWAFEFRHESWWNDEIYSILRKFDSSAGLLEIDTGSFLYARLRESPYSEPQQLAIAQRVRELTLSGKDVYAIFKHEDEPTGPRYAAKLLEAYRPK